MSDKNIINAINNLKEGYCVRCEGTHMPYVETNEESMNDQVFLFEDKVDAEKFINVRTKQGYKLTPLLLGPIRQKSADGKSERLLNGVRAYIATLPLINVDVVTFKGRDMKKGREVELSELLPEKLRKTAEDENRFNPLLQLNGILFCQQARRPKELVDAEELRACEEDFTDSLVHSSLFLAIVPPEGQPLPQSGTLANVSQFRHPLVKLTDGKNVMPVFTDIEELHKFAVGNAMGSIRVPFTHLHAFVKDKCDGVILNPTGFSLPILEAQIPAMLRRFGLEPITPGKNTQPEQQ